MTESQKLFEIQKEKELYESKVEFFTEIAHEIRTPLTLINGPLEVIREMHFEDVKLNKNLNVIAQNTKRLLDLVAQLLDFQKIGANKLKLKFETVDVTSLLKEICERFEPTIQYEKKELSLQTPEEVMTAVVDKESVTKIVSNLLNNALKYAKKEIQVKLEKKDDSLTIRVVSDGEKIPEDMREQIFAPFYRMESNMQKAKGIGIGLSLAKSLAALNKGKLYLEMADEVYNTFVLELPLSPTGQVEQQQQAVDTVPGILPDDGLVENEEIDKYTILLVEDNDDMLNFILERLKENFIVEVAHHGREALDILRDKRIDLVISDVMMPVMNGIECCEALKTDERTAHIPVILLTALAEERQQLEGYGAGADDYLPKPFSLAVLKAKINNLLKRSERLKLYFRDRFDLRTPEQTVANPDKEFVSKVTRVVLAHLQDPEFDVELFCSEMAMSRASLFRKLKSTTGCSASSFTRNIRIKRAAELLGQHAYSIGEVAAQVGFSDPNYFTRCFKEIYGITPSEFIQTSPSSQDSHSPLASSGK